MAGRSGSGHTVGFGRIGVRKDLVVLVADRNMEHALKGLFTRPEALGIRPIETDVFTHPQHDPGCATRGVGFLSNFSRRYDYGLLVFDHEGCGRERETPQVLQDSINKEFARSA